MLNRHFYDSLRISKQIFERIRFAGYMPLRVMGWPIRYIDKYHQYSE